MNNHHKLCYNDEYVDDSCELCQVINYVFDSITPECTCGHDGLQHYWHLVPCKQGAFLMSQHIDEVWEEA